MRRRLVNILVAVPLLLFLAVVVMWVRSYWTFDHVSYSARDWSLFAESGGGQFRFEYTRSTPDQWFVGDTGFSRHTDRADGPLRDGMMMPGSQVHLDVWGFWIVTGERWGDYHYAGFVPGWFLALLTSAPPVAWAGTRLSSLLRRGLCRSCGYDLRATPGRWCVRL